MWDCHGEVVETFGILPEKNTEMFFGGMNKLYLLMEKQHNRGQEGAGMASVKLNAVRAKNISSGRGRKERGLFRIFFLLSTGRLPNAGG